MDKSFVAREEPVSTREEIPFQPSLAQVLAENLHHPAVGRDVVVGLQDLRSGCTVRDVEQVRQAVRGGLIGTKNTDIALIPIQFHHIPNKRPNDSGRFREDRPGAVNLNGMIPEIRHS